MKFTYPQKNILDPEKKNIMVDETSTFFICIFARKFKKNYSTFPSIQFLLYKQKMGEKFEQEILSFPYIHFNKNLKTSLNDVDVLLHQLSETNTFEGFRKNNDDFYMFYSVEDDSIQHTYNTNDTLYWATMYEIVNRQKFANFDIHFSTFEFFYKNKSLIHCYNENNVIELPIVVLYDIEDSFLKMLQQFEEGKYYIELLLEKGGQNRVLKNKFIRLQIFDYNIKNNKIYYDKINSSIISIHKE
jgi:hypothetical protein